MSNELKDRFLDAIRQKFGRVEKLEGSQSLYEVGATLARIYIRYSRLHERHRTFYGLRKEDLRQLEGRTSFICFLWEGQESPLILPYADYEDVFHETPPARDGQYKTQIYLGTESTELYVARAGRFNVDAHVGWDAIESAIRVGKDDVPALSHRQIQTLLGSIGVLKQFDIWIPPHDRDALDWSIADRFPCVSKLPFDSSIHILLQEIDAIWIHRGSCQLVALYEIEHSTPVYSGLLRLNDIHLVLPSVQRLAIVSNEIRRSLFVRQLHRPTFQRSGLSDSCAFLEYRDVFHWHRRVAHARAS